MVGRDARVVRQDVARCAREDFRDNWEEVDILIQRGSAGHTVDQGV